MKAAELLRLYAAGRRDFSGESLRGQNFKGKDLSDADFSGADIRGANFTNANLTGAKFIRAVAGLQHRLIAGLLFCSLLLPVISGILLACASLAISTALSSVSLEGQVSAVVSLATIFLCSSLFFSRGMGVVTANVVGFIAISIALILSLGPFLGTVLAEAGTLAVAVAIVFTVTVAVTVATTAAVAITVAVATAVSGAFLGYFAGLGSVFSTSAFVRALYSSGALATFPFPSTNVLVTFVAGIIIFVGTIIGKRSLEGDERDGWVYSAAIAFSALGGTSFYEAVLTDANFSQACLKSTDFRRSVLLRTRWSDIEELDRVRSGENYLNNPKIRDLVCTGNGQGQSYDHLINLVGINLQGANLAQADLTGSTLKTGTLQGATLTNTYFIGADLNRVNLQCADLSNAQLIQTQLDQADLTGATLTGACIEDWNVNASTKLADVTCDYVYLKSNQRERRPSQGTFKPGEFAALFQQAVNTVDLIFKDGIDWQAFFQSFQDLRSQYADQNLSIQAIEKKQGDAFVIRLEVAEGSDRSAIESNAKQLYESQLRALEARYEKQLRLKGEQHSAEIQRLIAAERQEKATLMGVLTTMANNQGPKNDFRGAQFGGGYVAGNVEGNQYGGIINNYGSNAEDITRLLTALRDQAQTFPADQKDEANDTLDDLERDLADEQPDQGRIGRRLKRLVAIATTLTIGATAFTADLAQLADVLNVSLPQVEQVQPEQLPPSD